MPHAGRRVPDRDHAARAIFREAVDDRQVRSRTARCSRPCSRSRRHVRSAPRAGRCVVTVCTPRKMASPAIITISPTMSSAHDGASPCSKPNLPSPSLAGCACVPRKPQTRVSSFPAPVGMIWFAPAAPQGAQGTIIFGPLGAMPQKHARNAETRVRKRFCGWHDDNRRSAARAGKPRKRTRC